ncbi:MAG TPA: CDGSH iron-sulfur domain-containing protein [Solirubrobacteraceae bacterium]|jgi:CDGSH-type Zn-finger protein
MAHRDIRVDGDEAVIVPYPDGPYLVRGAFALRDQGGGTINVGRRTIALCRCGRSRTRPFCDGTHRAVGFKARSEVEADAPRPALISEAAIPRRSREPRLSRGSAALLSPLRSARSSLELAAESPCTARTYRTLRTAESLLAAASDLVEDGRGRESADAGSWGEAFLCLIQGALDALALAGDQGADVAPLVTQLTRVSKLVRAQATTP